MADAAQKTSTVERIETRDDAGKVVSIVFEIDGVPATPDQVRAHVKASVAAQVKLIPRDTKLGGAR